MNEDKIALVVLCCGCNRIVFAGDPEGMDRKDKNQIGRLAVSGHRVEHWRVEAVRNHGWVCECKGKKRK